MKPEIKKWYESFLLKLEEMDLDAHDPVTSVLISGFEVQQAKDVPGVNELIETKFGYKDGAADELSKLDKNASEIEKLTGTENIKKYKDLLNAPAELSEADIEKMYEYAKIGKLVLADKKLNYKNQRSLYRTTEGNCAVSAPTADFKAGDSMGEMQKAFPNAGDVEYFDMYMNNVKRNMTIQDKLTLDKAGKENSETKIQEIFNKNLIQDYFENPEYYKTPESAEARTGLIRMHSIAVNDKDYAKKHQFTASADKVGSEKSMIAEIEKYLDGKSFTDAIAEGSVRKPDGTSFKTGKYPWDAVLEIYDYLAKDDARIALYDGEKRLGTIKNNNTGNTFRFSEDSPTKGNEYTKAFSAELENVEATPELISFLHNLQDLLKQEADLDVNCLSDKPRLKCYYNDYNPLTQKKEITERDALMKWEYREDGNVMKFKADTSVNAENILSDVQNEMRQNNLSYEQLLKDITGGNASQAQLHHAFSLMELAKNGQLMVTKPGELIKDSHPVVLSGGKLEMLPGLKDADNELKHTNDAYFNA